MSEYYVKESDIMEITNEIVLEKTERASELLVRVKRDLSVIEDLLNDLQTATGEVLNG